jgi:PleD family two-component response regulator
MSSDRRALCVGIWSARITARGLETLAARDRGLMRAARILIVDDDALLQKSLALFLSIRGYEVEGAMTAHDALDAFARRRPDLIVLDLGLPDRDGNEVCLSVRQKIEPSPDHPRYLLSEPWVGYQLVTDPEKDSGLAQ